MLKVSVTHTSYSWRLIPRVADSSSCGCLWRLYVPTRLDFTSCSDYIGILDTRYNYYLWLSYQLQQHPIPSSKIQTDGTAEIYTQQHILIGFRVKQSKLTIHPESLGFLYSKVSRHNKCTQNNWNHSEIPIRPPHLKVTIAVIETICVYCNYSNTNI